MKGSILESFKSSGFTLSGEVFRNPLSFSGDIEKFGRIYHVTYHGWYDHIMVWTKDLKRDTDTCVLELPCKRLNLIYFLYGKTTPIQTSLF